MSQHSHLIFKHDAFTSLYSLSTDSVYPLIPFIPLSPSPLIPLSLDPLTSLSPHSSTPLSFFPPTNLLSQHFYFICKHAAFISLYSLSTDSAYPLIPLSPSPLLPRYSLYPPLSPLSPYPFIPLYLNMTHSCTLDTTAAGTIPLSPVFPLSPVIPLSPLSPVIPLSPVVPLSLDPYMAVYRERERAIYVYI